MSIGCNHGEKTPCMAKWKQLESMTAHQIYVLLVAKGSGCTLKESEENRKKIISTESFFFFIIINMNMHQAFFII